MPVQIETNPTALGSEFRIAGDSFAEVQSVIAGIMGADDTISATFDLPRRVGRHFEARGVQKSRSVAI